MTAYGIAAKGTRVLVFTSGLIVLMGTMRFVLSHPALRTAAGTSLLLLSAFAVLAFWAWILRKLWVLSGIAAAVVFHSDENKTEVQA